MYNKISYIHEHCAKNNQYFTADRERKEVFKYSFWKYGTMWICYRIQYCKDVELLSSGPYRYPFVWSLIWWSAHKFNAHMFNKLSLGRMRIHVTHFTAPAYILYYCPIFCTHIKRDTKLSSVSSLIFKRTQSSLVTHTHIRSIQDRSKNSAIINLNKSKQNHTINSIFWIFLYLAKGNTGRIPLHIPHIWVPRTFRCDAGRILTAHIRDI